MRNVLRIITLLSLRTAAMIVKVGAINAGTMYDVIPDETLLKVSVRTFDENVRAKVKKAIERIAAAESEASGATRPPEITQAETARFSRVGII